MKDSVKQEANKMEKEYNPWDYITKEDEEVIKAINWFKEKCPKEAKVVTNYMEKLVRIIEGKEKRN